MVELSNPFDFSSDVEMRFDIPGSDNNVFWRGAPVRDRPDFFAFTCKENVRSESAWLIAKLSEHAIRILLNNGLGLLDILPELAADIAGHLLLKPFPQRGGLLGRSCQHEQEAEYNCVRDLLAHRELLVLLWGQVGAEPMARIPSPGEDIARPTHEAAKHLEWVKTLEALDDVDGIGPFSGDEL